jgi:HD-like signal output (HDOD) protein
MEQLKQQPTQTPQVREPAPRTRPRLVLVTGGEQAAASSGASDPRGAAAAEQLLRVELPARPNVVMALSAEMQKEEADFHRVAELINADPGLGSAVVKTANSPYVGLGRKVSSVAQAIYYLGLGEVFSIVTGLMLRKVFALNDARMERLWDDASRRAGLMATLAREGRWLQPDRAHTCGLFEDCGMAVLLLHAPGYREIMGQLEQAPDPQELERSQYGLDHAVIGDALVRAWGLPEGIALAVRHHHRLDQLLRLGLPDDSMVLVALSALANEALARTRGRSGERWELDVAVLGKVLGETWPSLEERVAEAVQAVKAPR